MPAGKPSFPRLNRSHPLSQGLVGAWPFYEGSGTIVNDLAARGSSGTVGSGYYATFQRNTAWATPAAPEGYALNLPTTGTSGDFAGFGINTINKVINGVAGWSCVVGVNFASFGGSTGFSNGVFQWQINGASSTGGYLGTTSTGAPWAGARSTTADTSQAKTSSRTLSTNIWYQLAGIVDFKAATINIAIDGVLETATAATFGATSYTAGTATTNPDMIGDDSIDLGNGGTGAKKQSYVLFYNRVLSAAELSALAADPFAMCRSRRLVLKPGAVALLPRAVTVGGRAVTSGGRAILSAM